MRLLLREEKVKKLAGVFFVIIYAAALLILGLGLAEKGLQEVSGYSEPAGALRLNRGAEGLWVVTFAGDDWQLPVFQVRHR
jgi:hypothetical protein